MQILNEDPDHVVAVGRAADVASCGTDHDLGDETQRGHVPVDLTDSYARPGLFSWDAQIDG